MPNIARYILSILFITHYGHGFVLNNKHVITLLRPFTNSQLSLHMNKQNATITRNTSKIYKIDFSEENKNDYDELFEPRYIFGLSDYNLILLRIYIYMVITLHCLTMYADKLKK